MAVIIGTNGDDKLLGTKKDDLIRGQDGFDELAGNKGDDRLKGGDDYDFVNYYVETKGGGVVVDLASGKATDNWGDKDAVKQIEGVYGSSFDDKLKGNDEGNLLAGANGNDKLTGRGGGDEFVFYDSANSATNHDIIKDFNSAEGDSIKFTGAYKSLLTSTVQGSHTPLAPTEFVANAGGAPTTNTQHIVYDTTTGNLFYDPDGIATSGDQQLIATLRGAPTLTATNFEVWG